jgi:hypothetical protein
MSYIRNQEYSQERLRPKMLANYLISMTQYLQLRYPQATPEMIEGFVKEKIEEYYKTPIVEALVHPREGETKEVEMNLDKYVTSVIVDNNLSPSGTCYHPVSRRESFLRRSIDGKVKERNAFKKKYLMHEAQGEKREAQYYYQNQANSKIFNNAIAGGMAMKQFIMSCKAGFNAITSMGRTCVKQGYSYIERAVNGNIYLPTVRDAISYVLNHARHVPADFVPLIEQRDLYIPSVEDVWAYLLTSMENYTRQVEETGGNELRSVIAGLNEVERSYVFYAGCLNNLCRFNEAMMRTWIDSCFVQTTIDPSLYQQYDVGDIKKYQGDVVNAVLATNYRLLGENPKKPGKWNSLKDAVVNNPEGLKAFIYCCQHFVDNFEPQLRILRPILRIETTFSRMTMQHKMARYTVPLSDTDSNIFSTQELIRWKRGKLDFSQASYEMNALLVFILSQSLEHVFARLSAGFGVEGTDVFRISMKNEFLYPIVIVTALAKHYLAIATMQEGSLLPNPRKDIKGVGFRSSTYPKLVTKGFEEFVVHLFSVIEKGEPIKAGSILKHVADVEQTIFTSIHDHRESDYLQTVSVRREQDYADASKSNFFYHKFWQEVFAPTYGEMVIPNKCFKIPLKGGMRLFKNEEIMSKMQAEHPEIHERLVRFLENNKGRNISAILIPPFKGKLQPFFLEVMDLRAHISSVMAGYYHFLDALGIGTVDIRCNGLVSDFFDPSTALID